MFVLLQYNDLMKKKRIVENDKAKILQTIKELDQKKNEALNLAWQKVCFLFCTWFLWIRFTVLNSFPNIFSDNKPPFDFFFIIIIY